tara:strand:- start:132 stop:719 length:588 start_codon:yes stop_codon:yes gene_type:complete
MAYRSVGVGTSVSIPNPESAAVQTDVFAVQSDTIRIVAVGADCHVTVGSTPSATAENLYIPSGGTMSLGMTKASQRVLGITTHATATTVTFPEGTQCPFGVGNYISVTGTGDAGITSFTKHKRVLSVDTTASYDGNFMTSCTIAADTRKCTAADGDFTDARAIASHRVSVIGASGAHNAAGGHIHCHQVQITGEG